MCGYERFEGDSKNFDLNDLKKVEWMIEWKLFHLSQALLSNFIFQLYILVWIRLNFFL
jgi:hypothetical protein